MAANPLVRQLGLQQVLERDAPPPPPSQDLSGQLLESALAGHVRLSWSRNKLSKFRIDEKLLQDLRSRRGVYSPSELATMQSTNGGMNILWSPVTETKCRAASAWIREIVLPVGEQPWGVDPSPVPDLPMQIKKSVVAKALQAAQQVMQQTAQAGGGVMNPGEFRDLTLQLGDKLRDDAEKTFTKQAKARAVRMEAVIGDRLLDGGYAAAVDAFVEDFVTYPAAILKGPFYTHKKEMTWGPDWKPIVKAVPVQTWARVSPFDAYPAAASVSPQKGDFIERMRFRRDELWNNKDLPGWKNDQIDSALRDYTNGHLEAWLWTESERQRLEQETTWMWLSPPGVIDALNFWGSVPGWKLMSWGVQGDLEETCDYECNVVLCGRYVLYATLNPNPMGTRPYRKACYDEIPGAFWGRSIPDLARACQQFCNAAACALADNLSIASGPQTWVHADRFADGEQSMEMFPWKLWQLKSDPTQGVNPGIGFFQPDDRSGPLMAVYEHWEVKADDATGIPRYTYGNDATGGSADTATGLSMLMNNAAKGLRRAISNIDLNVIAPTINDTFVNEMMYNPDHSIKGDCVIVPRGAAAILIRESAQQRRLQFLTLTANPIDAPIIGPKHRAALLRETAAAMDLPVNDVVPTDDEIDQSMAQNAQAMQAQQGQLQAMEAQKEQAIAQRENSAQQTKALGEIVKTSVAAAMANKQSAGVSP
jgi:hypothetical protein